MFLRRCGPSENRNSLKTCKRGERVAFVGDGINDAPALEAADLGIAVSRASDVAREAADIILLKSEIQAIPEALGLARATLRTIKWNLFWAFFYNALGVPLAAMGFISPIFCAAGDGLLGFGCDWQCAAAAALAQLNFAAFPRLPALKARATARDSPWGTGRRSS
jgi:hypothetical protein